MMFFHILLSGTHISYLSDPRKSAQNCVANCHRELAHSSLLPDMCFSLKGFNISISFVTALFRENAMITMFECGLLTALKIHPACLNISMLGKYINSEQEEKGILRKSWSDYISGIVWELTFCAPAFISFPSVRLVMW